MQKFKIYDCFCFFNELDLLELRLHTLAEHVDKFVLVEATRTHQNQPKPLYFHESRNRYGPFLEKIIHVVVENYPSFWAKFRRPTAWDLEKHQKDAIAKGLRGCAAHDVILFSDVDEIPNPAFITQGKGKENIFVFEQRHYYFYFNYLAIEAETKDGVSENCLWWYGTLMFPYKRLTSFSKMRRLRDYKKYPKTIVLPDAGWHFGYLGGVEKVIEKLEAFAHAEYNQPQYKNPSYIRAAIESGRSLYAERPFRLKKVALDSSFPPYLVARRDLFERHLLD